ncbi:B3 domain-containing protein At4g34400-like isoform X1 [Rosa rugosa]|uniref:B3 domain-containing protein At4g34400-like isoform X1 n=1 Tax=Rosa rugosa TaxID=74645 RepID=UPI002B40CC5B|nr:B3 domain-containing protein At4g34400-like isoform X1 [Rosa rugosa]
MATTRKPSFFKVLIGDHFCNRLKIPGAFLEHFDERVPEQCHLRIGTQTWLVDVEMVNQKFYFQNGWKEFVLENGLRGCEFLVFFYNGNSEFYVHIYGKNACRKEFAVAATGVSGTPKSMRVGSSRGMEEADSNDSSVQILDDFPTCSRRAGEKSSVPSHQQHKKDSRSWIGKETHGPKPGITTFTGKDDFPAEQYVGGTSSSKPKHEVLGRMYTDDDDDDKEEEESEEDDDDCEKDEESEEDENEADSEDDDEFENEADSEDKDGYEDEEEEEESDGDGDEGKSDDSIEILDEFPRCSKAKTMRKSSGLQKRKINSSKAKAKRSITRASGSSSNQKITGWKYKVLRKMPGSNGIGELIARHRAKDFISKSDKLDSCLIAMSPSYIRGSCVHFPRTFAYRHLGRHCSRIKLRVNKRRWRLGIYHVHKTVRLQAGWIEFKHDNNLKVGDVCVFELTDSINVLDVTIFRAAEAANCTLPGGRQTTGVQFKSEKGKEKAG